MKLVAVTLSRFPLFTSAIVISCFALAGLQAATKNKKEPSTFEPEPQSWSQKAAAEWIQAADGFDVAPLQESVGARGDELVFLRRSGSGQEWGN